VVLYEIDTTSYILTYEPLSFTIFFAWQLFTCANTDLTIEQV